MRRPRKFTLLLQARTDLRENVNLMLRDPLTCFEQCVATDGDISQIDNI